MDPEVLFSLLRYFSREISAKLSCLNSSLNKSVKEIESQQSIWMRRVEERLSITIPYELVNKNWKSIYPYSGSKISLILYGDVDLIQLFWNEIRVELGEAFEQFVMDLLWKFYWKDKLEALVCLLKMFIESDDKSIISGSSGNDCLNRFILKLLIQSIADNKYDGAKLVSKYLDYSCLDKSELDVLRNEGPYEINYTTMLMRIVEKGNTKLMRFLFDLRRKFGETEKLSIKRWPISRLVTCDVEVFEIIFEECADMDSDFRNALLENACHSEKPQLVKWLLQDKSLVIKNANVIKNAIIRNTNREFFRIIIRDRRITGWLSEDLTRMDIESILFALEEDVLPLEEVHCLVKKIISGRTTWADISLLLFHDKVVLVGVNFLEALYERNYNIVLSVICCPKVELDRWEEAMNYGVSRKNYDLIRAFLDCSRMKRYLPEDSPERVYYQELVNMKRK